MTQCILYCRHTILGGILWAAFSTMILMEGSAQVFPSAAVAPCTVPPPMQVNGVAQENCPTALSQQTLLFSIVVHVAHGRSSQVFALRRHEKTLSSLPRQLSLLSLLLGGTAAKIL